MSTPYSPCTAPLRSEIESMLDLKRPVCVPGTLLTLSRYSLKQRDGGPEMSGMCTPYSPYTFPSRSETEGMLGLRRPPCVPRTPRTPRYGLKQRAWWVWKGQLDRGKTDNTAGLTEATHHIQHLTAEIWKRPRGISTGPTALPWQL